MSNTSDSPKATWKLLGVLCFVFIGAIVAGALYFKARNDKIRTDMNLKQGENYQDVIKELGKPE